MKRLLSKKSLIGAAGLSLIELIVSMAILATVGLAIGGAMYVSSKSYTRNSAEINVQEEAQIASNLICDWLVDAQEVSPDDTGATGVSTLEIKHWEDGRLVTVKIYLSGTDLKYEAKNDSGIAIASGTLASNVTGVNFISKFKDSRNVQIAIDFKVNDRTYHSVTDSTSRNHDFIADASSNNNAKPIITFDLPPTRGASAFDVFLEPGQNDTHSSSFTFNATVYNYDPSNTTFTVTNSNGADVTCTFTDNGTNVFPIKCTTTDTAKDEDTYTFTATKTIRDPNTGAITATLVDTKTLTVNIRRATECKFVDENGLHVTELADTDIVTGTPGTAGTVYKAVSLNVGSQCYPQVPGAAYDTIFKDASSVKYEYRFEDGSDASAFVEATEVTSGSPSVQVKLAQNITQDIYVIAVSTHQGDMTAGSGNYNCGVTADNRLRAQYSVSGFNYYDSVAVDKTWDYFKIPAPITGPNPPDPYTIANHDIARGTPSFEYGYLNADYRNWLLAYLTNPTSAGGLGYDLNTVQSGFEFYTTIKYREVGSGTSWNSLSPYVLYCTNNWHNLAQHQNTQGFSAVPKYETSGYVYGNGPAHYHNGYESFFYELNKSYDVQITFNVYDNHHNFVYSTSQVTNVPAARPNIYDPSDANKLFKVNTYNYDVTNNSGNYYNFTYHPHDGGVSDEICVYFDSVNMNEAVWRINYYVEKYVGGSWVDCSSDFSSYIQIDWKEGQFDGSYNKVRIPNATLASGFEEYICKGYDENATSCGSVHGVSLEAIQLHGDAPFMNGTTYRIGFRTNYPYAASDNIYNGIFGTADGVDGCVSGYHTDRTYDLSDPVANTGYIYIKGNA